MRLFVWRLDGKSMSVGRTSAEMSECKLESSAEEGRCVGLAKSECRSTRNEGSVGQQEKTP